MGTNAALATNTILAEAPEHAAARGAHARTKQAVPDIHVIACPGGANRHLPRHARAATAALPRTSTGDSGGLGRRLRGVAFGLTAREQAFAAGAGVLFTVAALAAILL